MFSLQKFVELAAKQIIGLKCIFVPFKKKKQALFFNNKKKKWGGRIPSDLTAHANPLKIT